MTWVADEGQVLSSGILLLIPLWFINTHYLHSKSFVSRVSHLKLGIEYWQCKALTELVFFLLLGSLVSASKFGHMNQLLNAIPSGKRLQSEYMNALCDKARSGEYDVERLKKHYLNITCSFLDIIYHHLSVFLSVCLSLCLSLCRPVSLARSFAISDNTQSNYLEMNLHTSILSSRWRGHKVRQVAYKILSRQEVEKPESRALRN